MADAEKILPLFIHDLRTPIGVAQGYLRLLQEQRLATAEEREQALARAMDALGRLSRLCHEAGSFADLSGVPTIAVDASALVARVAVRVRDLGLATTGEVDPAARLRIAGDPDRLAEAIMVVLGMVAGSDGKLAESVLMETRMSELRFAATRKDTSPGDESRSQLDPWRGHGLGVALAGHRIAAARGEIWTTRTSVQVAFPLEVLA